MPNNPTSTTNSAPFTGEEQQRSISVVKHTPLASPWTVRAGMGGTTGLGGMPSRAAVAPPVPQGFVMEPH